MMLLIEGDVLIERVINRIKKSMRRSAGGASNDQSLNALRLYSMIAFLCVFVLLTGILLLSLYTLNDIKQGLIQTKYAGERLELTAYTALLSREIRAIGINPTLQYKNIPGMTDIALHTNLHDNAVKLGTTQMLLTVGDDNVKPLSDQFNTQLNEVPNVIVLEFKPGVLTLPFAMNHYISSLYVVAESNTTLLYEVMSDNVTNTGEIDTINLKKKYKYAVENGHYSILDACDDSVTGVVSYYAASLTSMVYYSLGTVALSVLFLIVVGLVVFKQALQDVRGLCELSDHN